MITEILPLLLGGLILFVYAISKLSKSMQGLATEKSKSIIQKCTRNLFTAILVGTFITIVLGSSSASIILAIVCINAGILNFKQTIGIIMGANIGTTFSSQLIALDIAKYALIPLAIGAILEMLAREEKLKQYGKALFYFGLLFFGLFVIEKSVLPLKDSSFFNDLMYHIDKNLIKGTLVGGFTTLIIQSSSATVSMAIVLGKQDIITLSGAIAVMLGSELGTCSDTLIATIKGSRQAIKAGLFHLFFNLSTIIIGLLTFHWFFELVVYVSGSQLLENQIANAHMLFNILGVVLFLPFVGFTEKVLNFLLPDKLSGSLT